MAYQLCLCVETRQRQKKRSRGAEGKIGDEEKRSRRRRRRKEEPRHCLPGDSAVFIADETQERRRGEGEKRRSI